MITQDRENFTFGQAKEEFNEAWNNPSHTRFDLPPVDVNRVLRERYKTEPADAAMNLAQLWDMEVRKAWDPATYIPYVVSSGRSWSRHALEQGCERFFRISDQVSWVSENRGEVIEDVSISHPERRIYFLGRAQIVDDRGEVVEASEFQPLFHVEHAAEGSEERPINIWRVVVLTEREDDRFKRPFEQMIAAGYLQGFIEIYLQNDMGVHFLRQ